MKTILTLEEAAEYFDIDFNAISKSLSEFSEKLILLERSKGVVSSNCNQYGLFGVDFILDVNHSMKILEFNAKPDIALNPFDVNYNDKLEIYRNVYLELLMRNKFKYDFMIQRLLSEPAKFMSLEAFVTRAEEFNCLFNLQ